MLLTKNLIRGLKRLGRDLERGAFNSIQLSLFFHKILASAKLQSF